MRVRLSGSLLVLCAVAGGCEPEPRCSGALYYDPVLISCWPCPMDATFKNGTCQCKDSYEFVNHRCVLMDGAVIEMPDTGTPAASSCMDYCDFAKVCIGDNALAKSALSDIVSGLHADDTAACTSSCESDLGGDGSSDPVVACIEAGREAAACTTADSQMGLGNTFGLLGDCCRSRQDNALCKAICKPLKANALVSGMIDFCK